MAEEHLLTVEVSHSHRHGGYSRRVRARRVGVDSREHQAGHAVSTVQLIPASGRGPVRRIVQLGSWVCHRHRWRSCWWSAVEVQAELTSTGRQGVHAAVESVCWHGADIDFRRGAGAIWVSPPMARVLRLTWTD